MLQPHPHVQFQVHVSARHATVDGSARPLVSAERAAWRALLNCTANEHRCS